MKPGKHLLGATGVLAITAWLIALTWIGASRSVDDTRHQTLAHADKRLTAQARMLSEDIEQQIRVLDQSLKVAASAWENNPQSFDLAAWRDPTLAVNSDIILADASGIIRQSSVAEGVGQRLGSPEEFHVMAEQADQTGRLYLGPPTIDPILRQWHMNAARAVHGPDGAFAGVIVTDYRLASVTHTLEQASLGDNGFAALIGLRDSRLRGVAMSGTADGTVRIADTPLFTEISRVRDGLWTGRSPIDAVIRIHAFRRLSDQDLPDQGLTVVAAMDRQEAMEPAAAWQRLAYAAAAAITVLLGSIALLLLRAARAGARHTAALANSQADLAAMAAQLEVSRETAEARGEQLAATLSGMQDGLSIFDAQMCLVEWNDHFADVAGCPSDLLRVGLPVEQILRAQALDGQFGAIDSVDAEVARRMVRLRTGPYGVVQRQRPDGHTIELRRKALPQGGFVTLYADITDQKRSETAIRDARAAAETATAARARFLSILAEDVRAPLQAITDACMTAPDQGQPAERRQILPTLRQAADTLQSLIDNMAAVARIETDGVTPQPALFAVRPMLEAVASTQREAAAERGINLLVAVAEGMPAAVSADARLLRQVVQMVLSHAVRRGARGDVMLLAEVVPEAAPITASDASQPVRFRISDSGPPIDPAIRPRLFQPIARLDRRGDDAWATTAVGFSICHELITLLGGTIGCESWTAPDGRVGNAFWLTLPASALPASAMPAADISAVAAPAAGMPANAERVGMPDIAAPDALSVAAPDMADARAAVRIEPRHRRLPRTRILLVEDVVASQIVASTLLRREGHMVDIADCGEAAVAAVQRSLYDLVFMDIMMPGIGGHEATRSIRTLSGPACATPIIALTADVSSGDEAAFRAAGMDGILGKPVVLAELLDAVSTHVWFGTASKAWRGAPAGGANASAETSPPAAALGNGAMATGLVVGGPVPSGGMAGELVAGATRAGGVVPPATVAQPPVLSADRILELRGNLLPETFVSLVEECLVDLDSRLPALRRAVAASAVNAVTAHAHAMVGMAAAYGMPALEARLRAIMAAARGNELASLSPDTMAQVEADLAAATRTLREMMQDVLA